ncbi:hypothetical protein ABIB90_007731 [Bradyrhizobium sp. JR4.1]|nr:hypothetical protein Bra1253DRAFT_07526 [Bradyrhizobium sp. WSM1253]
MLTFPARIECAGWSKHSSNLQELETRMQCSAMHD